jgi:hypothetical protein
MSVRLPNNLQKLERELFYGCTKLTSITIPETVTYIGTSTFDATAITHLVIPDSVTYMDSGVCIETLRELTIGKGIQDLNFELRNNGCVVQQGYTGNMLFAVDDLIAYVSQYMTLKIGDFIFTGTPAGVGSIQIGDTLEGLLENRPMLSCRIK